MTLTAEDRVQITDFGRGSLQGVAAIRDAALALGEWNPVGHHITNIVLTELTDDRVHARSKGIAIHADGTCASVTNDDTISRGDRGWRISHRRILARRAPLGAG